MNDKFHVFDKVEQGWLRWDIPEDTPEIPLTVVEVKVSASEFSQSEVEKLLESADTDKRFEVTKVSDAVF
ncbi:MAG: hypothetical protein K2Z81_07225 [Cyanobacteria bacterium]|nr:hypothetical protein [Cyanobacteriota bacterium]